MKGLFQICFLYFANESDSTFTCRHWYSSKRKQFLHTAEENVLVMLLERIWHYVQKSGHFFTSQMKALNSLHKPPGDLLISSMFDMGLNRKGANLI